MHRILSGLTLAAFVSLLGVGAVDAKQCRDAHGKFMKCPSHVMHKPCRDPKTGKFVKCSKM